MATYKDVNDLVDSINILKGNIKLFYEGNISVYRVIAGQLWILLCDGKNSLAPRIFQDVKLYPLFGYVTKEEDEEWRRKFGHSIKEGVVFQLPAMVHFNGKGCTKLELLFDKNKPPLQLEEWLDQDFLSQTITIRQLIKSIRHKEAAHSDKNYDDALKFVKQIQIGNEEIHFRSIVALGEYILNYLESRLDGTK